MAQTLNAALSSSFTTATAARTGTNASLSSLTAHTLLERDENEIEAIGPSMLSYWMWSIGAVLLLTGMVWALMWLRRRGLGPAQDAPVVRGPDQVDTNQYCIDEGSGVQPPALVYQPTRAPDVVDANHGAAVELRRSES